MNADDRLATTRYDYPQIIRLPRSADDAAA